MPYCAAERLLLRMGRRGAPCCRNRKGWLVAFGRKVMTIQEYYVRVHAVMTPPGQISLLQELPLWRHGRGVSGAAEGVDSSIQTLADR